MSSPRRISVRSSLATNLRALRHERGLSQESLAALAGIHRNYLGGIERRERNVGIDNLEKIAAALRVPVSELLDERSRSSSPLKNY